MGSQEVVDLALSDDDADTGVTVKRSNAGEDGMGQRQIDLTDEVLEITPNAHLATAETASRYGHQTGQPADTRGPSTAYGGNGGIGDDSLTPQPAGASPHVGQTPSIASSTLKISGTEEFRINSYNSNGIEQAVTTPTATVATPTRLSGQKQTCASCADTNVPRRHTFSLERCGHGLCPACMVKSVSSSTSTDPTCPVAGCAKLVSVRDLALVLQEQAWEALQAKRLAAFRQRAEMGVQCPACSSPIGSSCAAEDHGVVGSSGTDRGSRVGGTARQRSEGLLSTPAVVCESCTMRCCRFCGTSVAIHSPPCPCGGAKLWSATGLLDLLRELVDNPSDATLTGPACPIKQTGGGNGRGRGGRGRGRGAYAAGSPGGRGRGRGKPTWASQAIPGDISGYGGPKYGGRGGPKGIHPKWSKGTGYGGGGDAAAAASAQAVAAEAESRADAAMAVVFDALASCLPPRGDYPEHVPEFVALVRESTLLQVVCAYLRNDSLMDIFKRRDLYQSLFKLVLGFALHELLAPLIDHVPPRGGAGAKTSSSSSSGGGGSSSGDFGGESGSPSAVKGKGKGRGEVPDAAQNGGVLPGDEVQPPAIGTPVAGTPVGGTADALGLEQAAETPTATVAIVAATPEPQAGQGDQGDDEELEVWAPPHSELAKEEASEVQEEEDYVSVADLLASANRQAKVFAQAPGTGGGGKRGDPAALAFVSKVSEVYDKVKSSLTYLRGLAEARASSAAVIALTSAMGNGGVAGAGLGRKRKREQLDCVEVSLESRYVGELGDSRFKLVPLLGPGLYHHFSTQASKQKGGAGGRARAVRISQEVSSLATSLPVQPDSSIFLRVDEDRFDVMRAMITGPKDTPYEGGCYEFDILLPPDYPNRPPQVHFLTTGAGRIRFNPNLYNGGKVCLSLLGTWTGPGWNPKTSTLLQVLVSIQSLIFVTEPYFNEPGYERYLGTPRGQAASQSYNSRIRNANILFAVVAALEKPSGPMRDVIRKHFRLIKGRMLQTARAWLREAGWQSTSGKPSHNMGAPDGGCHVNFPALAEVIGKMQKLISEL